MKRRRSSPSSCGEDFGGGAADRPSFKDWPWRDPDRSSSSSHRRAYSRTESSRSYDRLADDGWEPSRSLRRRYDRDPEPFDWRRGYDRHRDGGDRLIQASSPRGSGSYGSDRIHPSESFSGLRREVPKGFRSERDRSRREANGSSPWWRSRSSKELAADEVRKSPSIDSDSVGRRSHVASPDDRRGKVRSSDSSSGEQPRIVETKTISTGEQSRRAEMKTVKAANASRESGGNSEMEEGELEPDPQPQVEDVDSKAATGFESDNCKDRDPEYHNIPEEDSEKKEVGPDGKKAPVDGNGVLDIKEEGKLKDAVMDEGNTIDVVTSDQNDAVKELDEIMAEEERKMDEGNTIDEVTSDQNDAVKELDGSKAEEEVKAKDDSGDNEVKGNSCEKKQEVCEEDSSRFQDHELEGNDEDETDDEEELKEMTSSISLLQEENLIENKEEAQCNEAEAEVELKHEIGNEQDLETELQTKEADETGIGLEAEQREQRVITLETQPEGAVSLFDQNKEITLENNHEVMTLTLIREQTKQEYKDKGKSVASSLSTMGDPVEDDVAIEGPSGRGFELIFRSDTSKPEKANCGGIITCKHEDEKLKMEPLDLSLALPGGSSVQSLKHSKPKPGNPSRAESIQSLPSSFWMNSDGFTTSISFTSSQPFVHNPSCSLTQNSLDSYDYEHSVGSRPIFQGVDQVSSGTIWQAQTSNDSKRTGAVPLFSRVLLNGNSSHNLLHTMNGQYHLNPNGLSQQSILPRPMSPTNSNGSHESRSQHSKDKRLLTGGRTSSSLLRREHQDGEQLVVNGSGVMEKIVSQIVAEPLHLSGRILQKMTHNSLAYLKETICEMLTGTDKSWQLHEFQEALRRRSDLNMDSLTNCPQVLLEILVVIKTGLSDFLQKTNNLSSSVLVDILLNLKCRNLACRSSLPVDDCECKICIERAGFCSACMCLVCSKFDNASNTCSWVGCDVCLHWCHTNCGLRDSHIRNGQSASGEAITEMQFYCVACHHPSEMFGFVKEVFKTCAKDWRAETLAKELQYVRRIFSACNDVRGKRLKDLADQMLVNLEKEANNSEVVIHILAFLSDGESNSSISPSLFIPKASSRNETGGSNAMACSSKELSPSIPLEKASIVDNVGLLSSVDYVQMSRKVRDVELQMNLEKKPVVDELENAVKFRQAETKIDKECAYDARREGEGRKARDAEVQMKFEKKPVDELDSVVKFKQAEAKMYQERANDARREAESLKHIAMAKSSKIDEDYASRIGKLRLGEAKERHRQKLEELQALERANREYFNMKMRMEADIKNLLLKMEATRRNINT